MSCHLRGEGQLLPYRKQTLLAPANGRVVTAPQWNETRHGADDILFVIADDDNSAEVALARQRLDQAKLTLRMSLLGATAAKKAAVRAKVQAKRTRANMLSQRVKALSRAQGFVMAEEMEAARRAEIEAAADVARAEQEAVPTVRGSEPSDIVEKREAVRAAAARLSSLIRDADDLTVRAPFAGALVTQQWPTVGQWVRQGQRLAVFADTERVRPVVRLGSAAPVALVDRQADAQLMVPGQARRVERVRVHTVRARAEGGWDVELAGMPVASGEFLRPGMTLDARLPTQPLSIAAFFYRAFLGTAVQLFEDLL